MFDSVRAILLKIATSFQEESDSIFFFLKLFVVVCSLQKLELIMYVVPESMKGLDHIKTLVVWPNTQESTPVSGGF